MAGISDSDWAKAVSDTNADLDAFSKGDAGAWGRLASTFDDTYGYDKLFTLTSAQKSTFDTLKARYLSTLNATKTETTSSGSTPTVTITQTAGTVSGPTESHYELIDPYGQWNWVFTSRGYWVMAWTKPPAGWPKATTGNAFLPDPPKGYHWVQDRAGAPNDHGFAYELVKDGEKPKSEGAHDPSRHPEWNPPFSGNAFKHYLVSEKGAHFDETLDMSVSVQQIFKDGKLHNPEQLPQLKIGGPGSVIIWRDGEEIVFKAPEKGGMYSAFFYWFYDGKYVSGTNQIIGLQPGKTYVVHSDGDFLKKKFPVASALHNAAFVFAFLPILEEDSDTNTVVSDRIMHYKRELDRRAQFENDCTNLVESNINENVRGLLQLAHLGDISFDVTPQSQSAVVTPYDLNPLDNFDWQTILIVVAVVIIAVIIFIGVLAWRYTGS